MVERSEPALNALYQEVILKHYRNAPARGSLDAPDVEVAMNNPTCGDTIVLHLQVKDGVIAEVRFAGQGCAISQASASMMSQLVRGKSTSEVEAVFATFKEMLHGTADPAAVRALGELRALAGVSRFPARVRCAMLAWNALEEAERQLGERGGGASVVTQK